MRSAGVEVIYSGKPVKVDGRPNYLVLGDKQISRVNIMGVVVQKSDDEFKLDDGTGTVLIRNFGSSLPDIGVGDFFMVVGRLRIFTEGLYVLLESAKKIDKSWVKVRKLEVPGKSKSPDSEAVRMLSRLNEKK